MRRLVLLGAVLVLLVVGWAVQRGQQRRLVASEPARTLAVESERVTRLRVTRPGELPVQIERVAGSWRITAPGDYRASEPAFRARRSTCVIDVASTNPAKRSTFRWIDRHAQCEGDRACWTSSSARRARISHTYAPRGREIPRRRMLTYQFNKRLDCVKTPEAIRPASCIVFRFRRSMRLERRAIRRCAARAWRPEATDCSRWRRSCAAPQLDHRLRDAGLPRRAIHPPDFRLGRHRQRSQSSPGA
jgi:hypothetical protein